MILIIIVVILIVFFASGIRIVRPTHEMVIETLGKYTKTATQGFNWLIPLVQSGTYVNMTEQMNDTKKQTVITKDNLNASVDAVVYYKIRDSKDSLYNVDNHKIQIGSLTRTTLRNVVGNMSFSEANSQRDTINQKVEEVLTKETRSYGLDILRVELQTVEAPEDVQDAMNEVVMAERKKLSAKDFANAKEIEAEGQKRAEIQKAEGIKMSRILEAEGKAEAIKLENEAAEKYFIGNAQILKKLEVTNDSLKNNSKIIVPQGCELINVIGELAGTPININKGKNKE